MFPRVEVRHLQAVIALAEELNFTRAADRLTLPNLHSANRSLRSKHRIDFAYSLARTKRTWSSRKWAISSPKRLVRRSCT